MRYNNIRGFSVRIYNSEYKITHLSDKDIGIGVARIPTLASFGGGTYAVTIPLAHRERIVDVSCTVGTVGPGYRSVVPRLERTHGRPGLIQLTLSDPSGKLCPARRIGIVRLDFRVAVTHDRAYDESRYAAW